MNWEFAIDLIDLFNRLQTISLLCRCLTPKRRDILQEHDACLFYQNHPIAHAGLEFDYLNDDLPAHVIRGYTTTYSWKHRNKSLQLNINGAQMPDGYLVKSNRYEKYFEFKFTQMVMLFYCYFNFL